MLLLSVRKRRFSDRKRDALSMQRIGRESYSSFHRRGIGSPSKQRLSREGSRRRCPVASISSTLPRAFLFDALACWGDRIPDPRRGEELTAPYRPGVYDLLLRPTGHPVLFGIGGHLASRMTSLLPLPLGRGTRNNSVKRQFLLDHLSDVEYRTMSCETREEAASVERALPKKLYMFQT